MPVDVEKLKATSNRTGMPFRISKLGHVVIQVSDLEKSLDFYTQILGFKVSDVYSEKMMRGGMVFLRCHTDHHCVALVGAASRQITHQELHHFAFDAGCQIAVEFRDPDGHSVEIYWGMDQVGSDGRVRPSSEWNGVKSLEEAMANPVPGQDTRLSK